MKLYNIDLLDISNLILLDPSFKKQGSNIPILFHVSRDGGLTKLSPSKCNSFGDGIERPHVCFSKTLAGVCIGGTLQFGCGKTYLYVLDNRKITALQLKGHIFKAHDLVYILGRYSHEVDIDIEVPIVKIGVIDRKYDSRDLHSGVVVHGIVVDKNGKMVNLTDSDKARSGDLNARFSYNNLKDFLRDAKKINSDVPDISEDLIKPDKVFNKGPVSLIYEKKKYSRYIYKITDVKYDLIELLFGKLYAMKFKLHVLKQNKKFTSGHWL